MRTFGQATPPAAVTSSYALVYEDNFATDPSNAFGELQNIVGSSSAPLRPDWQYRTGKTLNCTLGTTANVFLSRTAGTLPGLILSDTASNPSSANANFPSGINEAYQTYTCGGLISTRRFGFGYYEVYANIGVYTPQTGFHTSWWRYNQNAGGYKLNETDIFENESFQNQINDKTTTPGFTQGIISWNGPISSGGIQTPNTRHGYHPSIPWSSISGGYAASHTFGLLINATGYNFYVDGSATTDGNTFDGNVPFAGPYVANEVTLSSVGSLLGSAHNTTHKQGPFIQYDGVHSSQTFNFAFQYVRYYQAINSPLLLTQALPPGSIFIDPTIPVTGTTGSSFSHTGSFAPYKSGVAPAIRYGPQGYLGQTAYTSTAEGDKATWAHAFTNSEAGSYDVYIWNASVGAYQVSKTESAPDGAMKTQYVLTGSVGSAPASQNIQQATSGQQWVPLNSAAGKTTYPTNTYAFGAGSTAKIILTVGNESGNTSANHPFVPHTNADSVSFVPVSTFATNSSTYSDSGFTASRLSGWPGAPASRDAHSATAVAQWRAPLPAAGTYSIYAWSPANSKTTKYAYYTLSDGSKVLGSKVVDQSANGNQWVPLGTYTWTGTTALVAVKNGNGAGHPANGYLHTNAIKIVPQLPFDYIVCTNSTGIYSATLYSSSGSWKQGRRGSNLCGGVDQTSSSVAATATFQPQVSVAGIYHAYVYADASLSSTARITVNSHSSQPGVCDGITLTGPSGWIYLGDYFFGPDSYPTGSGTTLTNDSVVIASAGGTLGVSALKLRYAGAPGIASNACTNN